MSKTKIRLFFTTIGYFLFFSFLGWYHSTYVHDVEGTLLHLAMLIAFPMVLLFVWSFDFLLNQTIYFKKQYGQLTALDCILAIALFYPSLMITQWGLKIISAI